MTQTVPATAVLGPGKTGLTIGLRVLNLDGTEYAAFSAAGVAETSVLGTYRKAAGVVVPDAGAYIVWGVSGTDYAEATVEPITALTDIQNRLPGVLVNGRIIADSTAIGNSQAAADAIKAMLTGVGGTVLSLAGLDVVASSAAPAVTISNAGTGSAVKLQSQSGHTLHLRQVAHANNSGIQIDSAGTGIWIVAANDNGIEITANGANAAALMLNAYAYGMIINGEIKPALILNSYALNRGALEIQHDGSVSSAGPGILVTSANAEGIKVAGGPASHDILLSGDGILSAILTALGVDAVTALHNLAPAGTPATGSVGAKLNTINANVAGIKTITDSLDRSALTVVAQNDVGAITIIATVSLAATISGLTIPADWTACYWTVKRSLDDADADAMVQILVSNPPDAEDGLQVLAGAAAEDGSAGSLTVNQALGTVTIALDDASTAELEDAVELVWDVKVHAPGAKTQPGAGTATITTAVTRA